MVHAIIIRTEHLEMLDHRIELKKSKVFLEKIFLKFCSFPSSFEQLKGTQNSVSDPRQSDVHEDFSVQGIKADV